MNRPIAQHFAASILLVAVLPCVAAAQTDVRVATWNIETIGAPTTAEYDAVRDILNRLGADVVGVNEINGDGDIANFNQLAADAGYAFTAVAGPTSFGADRNAFMSKLPFVGSPIYHTSAGLSGDPSANDLTRLIVEIVVDVPGNAGDLTLLVEHWKSGTANSDEFRRSGESFRMAQAVADLDTDIDAYLFMGDMNEEIDNVPQTPNPFVSLPTGLPAAFDLGTDLEAEMSSPGIVNNPFHYLELASGAQASALAALQLDGLDATRPSSGRRLDYILVSQALLNQGYAAEVYDSADEGLPGGLPKFGSPPPSGTSTSAADHFPVFADLTVPAAAGGCTGNPQCDDGVFCNGAEICSAGSCQAGSNPCPGQGCAETGDVCVPPSGEPWINEFHYDNTGTDTGEFVEIAAPAGLDLAGWQVIGYNGNGGATYATVSLSGVIPDQSACRGTLSFAFVGMQNGSPDGLALVDPASAVIEFISYEGSFVATSGPASGLTSVDIGVSEPDTTPVGFALQLAGTGGASSDFTWQAAGAATGGQPNTGQTFDGCGGCTSNPQCDDGVFCNGAETCTAGTCQAGSTVNCGDGVACTADACNEATDSCDHTPNNANCDDGLFCNGSETCHATLGCQAGSDPCAPAPCDEPTDTCISGPDVWLVFETTTTVPGLGAVENEDIVAYDLTTGEWSWIFDGSDVGLAGLAIDGADVLAGGDILLSFTAAGTVPGLTGGPSGESVDDSDIVRFTPITLGASTSGSFVFHFDGSDVGLTTNAEDVDAIDHDAAGRLVVSLEGSFTATGASGEDEDLIVFTATSLGATTAGSFAMHFDGSDVGLATNNDEDVDAAGFTSAGTILLSTLGNFSVTGASGADEDVFEFIPAQLGSTTSGTFAPFLDLSAIGISTSEDVKAVHLVE